MLRSVRWKALFADGPNPIAIVGVLAKAVAAPARGVDER
jgi:hypothetical protein